MNEPLYTDEQISTALDLYYRDHVRPTPYPAIAAAIGLPDHANGIDDILWKTVTGYQGNDADGPRRDFVPTPGRNRAGMLWRPREDRALLEAIDGEGQRRKPPVDFEYVAAVLARPVAEVRGRYNKLKADHLGRKGFGLA